MCKTFPPEFAQFLEYSYTLSFTEKLDYTCFQSSFWNVLTMSGPPIFNWQASGFFLVDLGALDVSHGAPMKNMHLEHHNDTTLKNSKRYVRLQLMVHTIWLIRWLWTVVSWINYHQMVTCAAAAAGIMKPGHVQVKSVATWHLMAWRWPWHTGSRLYYHPIVPVICNSVFVMLSVSPCFYDIQTSPNWSKTSW